MMSIEKQQRVKAFKQIDDRKRTVIGEMLARKMLSEYCHISEQQIFFKIGEHGKPYAVNCAEFNISHSKNMVVCAISDNSVGIDVEKIRPIGINILHKLCTDRDLEYMFGNMVSFNDLPACFSNKELKRFYELWSAKEAYFKCVGTGLKNLKSISMDKLMRNKKTYQIKDYIITVIESQK